MPEAIWCGSGDESLTSTKVPATGVTNNLFSPFNRRCRIYSGFRFLLAHQVPPFKHVKDKI